MSFDKKWGDMSPEEQDAAKSKYGNKQGWRDAKAKSQGYKDQSDKQEQKGQSQNAAMKNAGTSTGQSQGTSTGQSSSQSQQSSNSKPEQSSASYRPPANTSSNSSAGGSGNSAPSAEDKKQAAIKAADAYLANHPMKGKGSTKDAEYDRILKEGGLNNHTYQQIKKEQGKQQYEANKEAKFDLIQAQQEAKYEVNQAGGESLQKYGSAYDAFASNKESGDFYMTNPTNDGYEGYGADANNQANETVASKLMQSGNDFSWADYGMHKNGGAQNSHYNYDAYGGYDNWYNNHSAYSEGGWKGSQNVMDSAAIAGGTQQRTDTRNQYQLSDEYMKKYGQYDWAQNYYNNNINR